MDILPMKQAAALLPKPETNRLDGNQAARHVMLIPGLLTLPQSDFQGTLCPGRWGAIQPQDL